MKCIYFLPVCIVLISSQLVFSQSIQSPIPKSVAPILATPANLTPCPPIGFPDPGNNCPEAPILCPTLNGYCSTINNNNQPHNFPGCPGWTLNNDEWFAFYAGSTTINIQVVPTNCNVSGGQTGLQAGIYDGCGGPSMALQCSCTANPFNLNSNNYQIGHIYWFVLDGCNGSVCDYTINVLSGNTAGAPPNNPGPVNGPFQACQGLTTNYTLAPVTGATQYLWTIDPPNAGTIPTSTNNPNANVTWASNYTGPAEICVHPANLCDTNLTTSCYTVEVLPKPTAAISGSGLLCPGSATPIDLTITFTGNPNWIFTYARNGVPQPSITTSTNPYTLTVTQPGTYTLVSVQSSTGGCVGTVSGSAVITQSNLNATATNVAATCGESNGSINLTVTGGQTPYSFQWSSGQTTEDLSGIPGGPYTVTVTDMAGCTKTVTVNVNDNPTVLNLNAVVVNNTTCIDGNGSIDLTVTPNGSYVYNWSNGATTQDLSMLPPGPYTVTVTKGITCTATATYTVNNVPNQPNVNSNFTQTTCDLSNGGITLSVSGGVAPYTYLWSNGNTTSSLSAIPAGDYSVTVTGANGCTREITVTVPNNNPPFNVTSVILANTTCNGNGNGSINVSVAPNQPYTYTWSNGATTQDLSNLLPGSYSLTVSAGGSCTNEATFDVPDQPNLPSLNPNTMPSHCDLPNGNITLTVTGGVGPYAYQWSNGPTTSGQSGVPAGTYTVTVTGNNGCTQEAEVTVDNDNPPINITATTTANTTCNGNGNGSINVSVAPNGMYTYVWSNGPTTQDQTNLLPGSYTVTVSAGGSCTDEATFDVPDLPNTPDPNLTPHESTCDLSNGSVTMTVSGGVSPYTYLWSTGGTANNITGIPAGDYSVTVTGANGCTNEASTSVGNNNPPFNITAAVLPNTLCNGNGNGSINVSVTPNQPYTYVWSNGPTTQDQTNLMPGSYTVTVSAGGSCTDEASFDVDNVPNEPDGNLNPHESTCDLNNGSITLTVTGGVSPYTYQWSSGQTTNGLNGIPAGDYTVTITGANGCTTETSTVVSNNNPPFNITAALMPNTLCNGSGNGNVNVSVTPNQPYTYLWSSGQTTQDLSNQLGGTYTVTVSAGGSCIQEETFEVDDVPNVPDLFFSATSANCGLSNASVNLSISGGQPNFIYAWSSGQSTQDLNNVPEGIYEVVVTGGNGCVTQGSVVVDSYDIPVNIDGTANPQTSCQTINGSIALSLTPSSATVLWSTGSTSTNLNNLPAGDYSVTVSAGGTCTETATFTVDDNTTYPDLSTQVTSATCGLPNGGIDLQVNAGLAPFTYKWSNGAMTQDLTNLIPGNYDVTVTSAVGCTAVSSAGVPSNNFTPSIAETITANTSCGAPNGAISVTANPTNPYNYVWSTGVNSTQITNVAPGNYSVTVSLGLGCSASATYHVPNIAVSPNLSVVGVPATCGLANGATDASVGGGFPPYTYLWSNSYTTQDLTDLIAGTYAITVTDAMHCTSVATVNVVNNNIVLNVSGIDNDNTSCVSPNGSLDISVSPAGTYGYNWSNSATTQDLSSLAPGNYTVTVSLGSTCTTAASFNVGSNTPNPDLNPAITPAICSNPNGGINLSISGPAGPYVFAWSNSATSEDLSNILPGNYTVTVTAANGCTSDSTLVVPNNSTTFSLSGIAFPLTDCASPNGSIDLVVTGNATYTYLWSTGATTEDIANLPAGTYGVSVTETGSCIASTSFIVSDALASPSTSQSVSPEICGLSNGSLDLNVSGGVAPYTYSWASGQTSQDLNGIPAGAYAVTVTDVNHCTTTGTANVPGNSVSFSIAGNVADNTSCVTNDGSINLSLTPATPGNGLSYSYKWSNLATSEDISGVAPGLYVVTVSAGGSCTSTASFTIASTAQSPSVADAITPAFCGQNSGGIDLSVSGGQAPYSFQWSNAAVSEDLNALYPGNYDATITGANGCTVTGSYEVTENIVIPSISAITTANTSCVANNGAISLSLSPALNYSFQWGGGQTAQNLSSLPPGDYTVTVSGGGGCTADATFTVANNAAVVTLSGAATNILCFGDHTGAVDLTVSGGTVPYTYQWSPAAPGNPEDLSGLGAGTYKVTVTDPLGCSSTASFSITQPASSLQIACSANKPVSFPGATDGKASVTISGGTAPYTLTVTPGVTQNVLAAGSVALDNLAQGAYAVSVTDANGCPATCNYSIGIIGCDTKLGTMGSATLSNCGPGCITANYNSLGQFLEPGDVLQFILHEGSGGTIVNEIARSNQPKFCFDPALMSYGQTYYISAAAGDNDGSGNVLLGAYCTVVSIGTPIIFKEKPIAAIVQPPEISCAVLQVDLIGSSSLPGSGFAWTTVGGSIIGNPSQSTISTKKAGAYTLVVNTSGCLDTAAVQVTDITNQPEASVSASPDDILDCTIDEIVLGGTVEGTASANTIWLANGAVYANGTVLEIDAPGLYQFIIVDTLTQCRDTASITIDQNLAYPALFFPQPDALSCAHPSVTLTGGSPLPGINFQWVLVNGTDSTVVGTGTSVNIGAPGTYFLVGVDPVNHCTNAISHVVSADFNAPVADAGPSFLLYCFGESGVLDGSGSTGTSALTFQWSTSNGHIANGGNTAMPTVIEPGTYTLLVTSVGNGCVDEAEVVIPPKEPVAKATIQQPVCYGDHGAIRIDSLSGAQPPVKYSIDGGQNFTTQNVFNDLPSAAYSIIVQDANGCSTTVVAIIETPPIFDLHLEPLATIKLGESYQINAVVSVPLSDVANIQWTPTDGLSCDTCLNPIASVFHSMQYKLVVTNEYGCKDDGVLLLRVDRNVNIYVPNVFSPNGDNVNDVFLIFAEVPAVTKIKSFQIFDRWGEQVFEQYDFEPNKPEFGWTGRFRNTDLNPAVFVWYAVVEFIDGTEELLKGDVTLER